jgi:DNA-binding NarL/FixJ family response regulator
LIRVVVADDQALVRGGFRVLIDSAPDLTVVGEASDGTEAVAMARKFGPDVVLMDIRMPHLDGLEATRLICRTAETEHVKVLILTTFDLDEYVYAALRAGASGFLLKDTPPNDLLAAIRVVAAGDALLAPSVTRQLISEFARRPDSERPPPTALDMLTDRECEVLTLVARGWSNAEIADRLHVSPATAKTHVGRLLIKLQARDRTQLVVIAYETGLVTPGRRLTTLAGDARPTALPSAGGPAADRMLGAYALAPRNALPEGPVVTRISGGDRAPLATAWAMPRA